MTVEEYRNRLMDAFHNADCDELIAVVVRPEESEFKHLEWLLKNHYHNQKQQPCEDAVSRHDALNCVTGNEFRYRIVEDIKTLPSVTPKEKTGKWIKTQSGDDMFPEIIACSKCNNENSHLDFNEHSEPIGKVFIKSKYCPNCGARMVSE